MGHGDAYELRISRLTPDVHPEQQIEVILYLLPRSYPPPPLTLVAVGNSLPVCKNGSFAHQRGINSGFVCKNGDSAHGGGSKGLAARELGT